LTKLYHDLETRSPVDLVKCGVYAYASHPLTEITMFSWAIDDSPIQTWYPFFNEPIPLELEAALLNPEIILCAHNSSFERILETLSPGRIQKPFKPEVIAAIKPISRWHCTAAKAASAGLPRTLEGAAKALGLPAQKDIVGHRLMLRLCKPRGNGPNGEYIWYEDPDDVRREGLYCEQDVAVERNVDQTLPDLTPTEFKVWQVVERINDRGIAVDQELLACMANFVGDAERELNNRLRVATCQLHQEQDPRACKNPEKCSLACGCVPKISNPQAARKWLVAQGYDDTEEIDPNTKKPRGLGKDVVAGMLESDSLPSLVREVLIMRHEGGKSSTSKYKAALNRVNNDSRIRGTLVYCGAASTKRLSSRGFQTQNLTRGGTIPNILNAIPDIMEGADLETIKMFYGPPIIVASELVRPTFVAAKDKWLARGDYSQIEDRINNWLGQQTYQLEAFRKYDRGEGPDPYRVTAGQMFGVKPESIEKDDPRRQTGKAVRLGGGFQGGKGAILRTAKIYGVKITEERAEELKILFREANPGICDNWKLSDNAAIECMRQPPGYKSIIRPGWWFQRGRRVLIMRLPSGLILSYWYPRLEKVKVPWGERWSVTFWAEDSVTHQWCKNVGYGGLWTENACQSTSRSITVESLVRLEESGLLPVLSVHDENVCEAPKSLYSEPEMAADAVKQIMLQSEAWTTGIPINVDASAGTRYIKA
jgi:DNA polymerase